MVRGRGRQGGARVVAGKVARPQRELRDGADPRRLARRRSHSRRRGRYDRRVQRQARQRRQVARRVQGVRAGARVVPVGGGGHHHPRRRAAAADLQRGSHSDAEHQARPAERAHHGVVHAAQGFVRGGAELPAGRQDAAKQGGAGGRVGLDAFRGSSVVDGCPSYHQGSGRRADGRLSPERARRPNPRHPVDGRRPNLSGAGGRFRLRAVPVARVVRVRLRDGRRLEEDGGRVGRARSRDGRALHLERALPRRGEACRPRRGDPTPWGLDPWRDRPRRWRTLASRRRKADGALHRPRPRTDPRQQRRQCGHLRGLDTAEHRALEGVPFLCQSAVRDASVSPRREGKDRQGKRPRRRCLPGRRYARRHRPRSD